MDEIWLERDGARLFTVASGTGPAIILLHGGLATHQACQLFASSVSSRFRLITPDLRASGRSTYEGTLAWSQLADDIAALARHLAIERAVIGGISLGAGVAVRVALDHPELTAGLVLLHPAYGGADVGLAFEQRSAMQAMDAAGRRTVREGTQALLPLFDPLPPAVRERARAIVATYDPASVASFTRFMASEAQPFATGAELAAIDVPTLVVPGIDPYHPAEIADIYRRHLPRCTVRAVEPAGFADAIAELTYQTTASDRT
jgi:pimeloyl-ACP methyl ester carboxylesterase